MGNFEVRKRDGLARISLLLLEEEYSLPGIFDPEILFPDLRDCRFENVPLAAEKEFVSQYLHRGGEPPVWIHPAGESRAQSGDCVMVPCVSTALPNPRRYVDWLTRLKCSIPPDTAWYAPASALPSNLHLLVYTGFDLFDFTAVDLKSAQGLFCLPEGEFPRDWISRGVCDCCGCRKGDLEAHNRAALIREMAQVRQFLSDSRLRDLVECRSRMQATQVAILRLLDRNQKMMEEATPVARSLPLLATTGDVLSRTEVRRFSERVVGRYIPPRADVAVLLPCSARKPYSLSQTHRKLISAVGGRALELIVTSPLGLVPRELELVYPAAHYDVPVTGYWDAEELSFTAGIIAGFLNKHPFRRVIAHLEGGALEAARKASDQVGIPLEPTCMGRPVSPDSLAALDSALQGERRVRHDLVRGIGSWQFGVEIDTKGLLARGRYPELMVSRGKVPAFSLDHGTGLLRPTFEGWSLIPGPYRVEIDEFIPQGDVLAPGVVDADPAIREGDEVLVVGSQAMATGRAAMPAGEMKHSRRGVAVRVRKVKRL
ncbi:MAG: archaeosine synthase subunit alpha [Methanolinea sp.]|nr:archaeosine synthase subunit alpha [Methanolinea sp.]